MIESKGLRVYFKSRSKIVKAVDGVNIAVGQKEIVGLIGESGSGKTTVGRTILALQRPVEGEVIWNGKNVFDLRGDELKEFRRRNQIIYQIPYEAVDIRYKVYDVVAEGIRIHRLASTKDEEREMVLKVLENMGLTPPEEYAVALPLQLSGGQLQRVAIARALVLNPEMIVADEPVSMLDMSIRAGVLNIFTELREKGTGVLMITHDISTVAYVADRVYVMYLGKVVEQGPVERIVENPLHPYTQALIAAVPKPDPSSKVEVRLKGEITQVQKGCPLHPRCPFAFNACRENEPQLKEVEPDHYVSCFLH
ncbi:ABC transporter ATP-binding protein [Sulfodiicoccus acidiphilus]|uniref:ABC transporter ATP-binding protein n=1 Tax=Sulfodiicoccus acidiphilus TaxID=1670455 RepID=A0A348B2F7_9CREN|nr:ABC transporter ATP-binding protein [Sulfodiicoccus acidiphilus]BBD72359.1 ABC transporter ATP-binding protein [Sulfodiicoccus acidiphilus]GGT90050.1 ABC transporter ATP-binding protein [Sulfodiicoccus acidiphilus]